MTRRRHDPVTSLPLLQERFWRLMREHAPAVFDELARINVPCFFDAAVLAWATRYRLVNRHGEQPAWCRALAVETLNFWHADLDARAARGLLPWRILSVWNTDVVLRPPTLLEDPDEDPIAFRRRKQATILAHEEDLVRRGLAVVDRGGSNRHLVALIKHNCLRVSWEAIAGDADAARHLRRDVGNLAALLGFA